MSFVSVERRGSRDTPAVIGVIGCGNISHAYFRVINDTPWLRLKGCSGRNTATNAAAAARYGGIAMSIDELLADPEIEIVVNLTPPNVHHEIGRCVLEAGKHLYNEKPLAATLDQARDLIALAAERGLTLACAPDTWFGRPHRAGVAAIESGLIGTPVGGSVVMASHGMEHWHPSPEFFYQPGGGPLLDVGPYYLTQLVQLIGPVAKVTALASTASPTRRVTSPPGPERDIPVGVATTVNAALLMANGANVALTMSWDVWKHKRRPIEIYGTEGTLLNPDANFFIGGYLTPEKTMMSARGGEWVEAPGQDAEEPRDLAYAPIGGPRGLGVAEMALALAARRPPLARAEMGLHVLEVLLALERAAVEERAVSIVSRPD